MKLPLTRLALAALLAVGGAAGIAVVSSGPPASAPVPADAAGALAGLRVADEQPAGYQRDLFGYGWADFNKDGCDSRAEVLARDLVDEVTQSKPCRVMSGRYTDPYTGVSGVADASALDIDHVVSLGDAWRSGARDWTTARRFAYANDLDNLLAANDTENRRKSDLGPAAWSPPNPAGNCRYARTYVATKARWGLTVTEPDRAALERLLGGC